MKMFTRAAGGFKTIRLAAVVAIGLTASAPSVVSAQGTSVLCPPNIDFASGTFNNWNCYTGTWGFAAAPNPTTLSGPVVNRHEITSALTGNDIYGGFSQLAPGGGAYSVRVGNSNINSECERIRYTVNVPAGFNNYSFIFKYAVVLNDAGHPPAQQPRFLVTATDSATSNAINCATLTFVAGAGLPGFSTYGSLVNGAPVYTLPWTNGSINLSGQGGRTIFIDVLTADCNQGGHFGYGYFDIISCGEFKAAISNCDLNNNVVTFTGPPGYATYVWKDSTLGTTVGTGPTLTVPAPAIGTSTYYKVVLTPYNQNGCPDTVSTQRITNFTINATPDSICNTLGAPVQLHTNILTSYTGPFIYNWKTSNIANTISDTAIANPLAFPTTTGRYIVKVSDTIGCYRRDTVFIQNPDFSVNVGPDLTTCLGTPVTLNAVVTPASPLFTYTWTPSANLSSATVKNPVYTPTAVGTQQYIVRVDSAICAAVDTIKIRTLPNTFSINDTAVCQGVTFVPTASADPNFTFTWSPNINISSSTILQPTVTADTTRTYIVTAHYPTCPNIPKPFHVRVEPIPIVNLGPDVSKCQLTPLYIFANVNPTWYTNYTYAFNPDPNLNSLTIPNVIFTGQHDTTLVLTVKTPLGCTGRDSLHVHVYNSRFAAVTPSDTSVCPRDSVDYHVTGGSVYQWVPGTYLTDSNSSHPVAHPISGQAYTIYVTDVNGCHDTVQANINVNPEAVISLPDTVNVYSGETYTMNPTGNCLYYTWFPQNYLSDAHIANPIVTPEANTNYYVNARTEGGCVVRDSITVLYHEESALDLPNAFSPGSQPNALLKIVRRGEATLKSFRVYDRWGTKVFEATGIDDGWDGRLNGSPQPMGVYIYQVEAYTKTGHRFYKQGNVTLLR